MILVRFVDNDWNIVQRLIRIDICAKSVNGDQLAQELNECSSLENGVRGDSLMAAITDKASVKIASGLYSQRHSMLFAFLTLWTMSVIVLLSPI